LQIIIFYAITGIAPEKVCGGRQQKPENGIEHNNFKSGLFQNPLVISPLAL
jgi:hypothetical protein